MMVCFPLFFIFNTVNLIYIKKKCCNCPGAQFNINNPILLLTNNWKWGTEINVLFFVKKKRVYMWVPFPQVCSLGFDQNHFWSFEFGDWMIWSKTFFFLHFSSCVWKERENSRIMVDREKRLININFFLLRNWMFFVLTISFDDKNSI